MLALLMVIVSTVAVVSMNQPMSAVSESYKVQYEVAKGATPRQITVDLEKQKLIRSAVFMHTLGRVLGYWGKLKAAEYELNPAMTPIEILKVITSGVGIQRSFLIREGENIYQVADTLAGLGFGDKTVIVATLKDQSFMREMGFADPLPSSLEGYLSPTTYFFGKGDTLQMLIKRSIQRTFQLWKPEYDERARQLGFTQFEVIILASVIEKETGAKFERKIISSAFHNRLKKKMRLQSDPTIIYGMWEKYDGKIKKEDIRKPSPYNTYTIPRLPVGPICNPAPESIEAALYPDDTPYIFFVSRNDGTHEFSETYDQHREWVRKLQLDPKAREGKSWRDLKQ